MAQHNTGAATAYCYMKARPCAQAWELSGNNGATCSGASEVVCAMCNVAQQWCLHTTNVGWAGVIDHCLRENTKESITCG